MRDHSGLTLFFNQLERAIKAELSLPSLYMSLALPDILGQLEFGGPNGNAYSQWWEARMHPTTTRRISGREAWKLRNALFHHLGGSHERDRSTNIVFSFPELSMASFHLVDLKKGEDDVLIVHSILLATEIMKAAEAWLDNPPLDINQGLVDGMILIDREVMEPLGSGINLISFRKRSDGECLELSMSS
ncbi:MAG: hypothetical protein WBA44_15855 [Mesorhizobium sp.]